MTRVCILTSIVVAAEWPEPAFSLRSWWPRRGRTSILSYFLILRISQPYFLHLALYMFPREYVQQLCLLTVLAVATFSLVFLFVKRFLDVFIAGNCPYELFCNSFFMFKFSPLFPGPKTEKQCTASPPPARPWYAYRTGEGQCGFVLLLTVRLVLWCRIYWCISISFHGFVHGLSVRLVLWHGIYWCISIWLHGFVHGLSVRLVL